MVNLRESRITWNHLEVRLWALFPERIKTKPTLSVSDTIQWAGSQDWMEQPASWTTAFILLLLGHVTQSYHKPHASLTPGFPCREGQHP